MAMVQSIERAFEIIRQVTTSEEGIRLQELSHLCGLKKTTVFALAETLVSDQPWKQSYYDDHVNYASRKLEG